MRPEEYSPGNFPPEQGIFPQKMVPGTRNIPQGNGPGNREYSHRKMVPEKKQGVFPQENGHRKTGNILQGILPGTWNIPGKQGILLGAGPRKMETSTMK